nr:MAG TPA: hypothetical protein [Caudoviricetes sp.]
MFQWKQKNVLKISIWRIKNDTRRQKKDIYVNIAYIVNVRKKQKEW